MEMPSLEAGELSKGNGVSTYPSSNHWRCHFGINPFWCTPPSRQLPCSQNINGLSTSQLRPGVLRLERRALWHLAPHHLPASLPKWTSGLLPKALFPQHLLGKYAPKTSIPLCWFTKDLLPQRFFLDKEPTCRSRHKTQAGTFILFANICFPWKHFQNRS